MSDSNNRQRMGCKRAAKLNLFHASFSTVAAELVTRLSLLNSPRIRKTDGGLCSRRY